MSQLRHMVAKYHLFLFLLMKENLVLIGLKPKRNVRENIDITVKTIISINSKMDLYLR